MPELRQNALTGRWVAVAPTRGKRPVRATTGSSSSTARTEASSRDPECPFCPGNEAELPEIFWQISDERPPGWRCRAVPNLYAAFQEDTDEGMGRRATDEDPILTEDVGRGVEAGKRRPARGLQEVLIESPRHDRAPSTMGREELEAVVELYARRMARIARDRPAFSPILFRNHGPEAGASLRHPHAQLIATATVPPGVAIRERRMRHYHGERDACLLCSLSREEPDDEARRTLDGRHFRSLVPWAPERPLESWIVPRRHHAAFHLMEPDEMEELAGTLGRLLRAVRILAGNVDYNYIVHSASGADSTDPALHWFLQIRPVTARMAGFELGSGARIVATDPADDAARIRAALDRI